MDETPQIKMQLPTWIKVVIVIGVLALGFIIFLLLRKPAVTVENTIRDTYALDSLKSELKDALLLDSIHRSEYLYNITYLAFQRDSFKEKLKSQKEGLHKLKVQFKLDSISETKKSRSQKADEYIKWLHQKDSR